MEIPKEGIKLHKGNFIAIGREIQSLLDSGEVLRLQVKQWRDKRSLSQNAISHCFYAELSRYLIKNGRPFASDEWVKDAMKHTFLGYEKRERVDVRTGERKVIDTLRHTSDLDTGEMYQYLTQVEQWAMGIGCKLTVPEDSEFKKLKDKQNE